MFIDNESQCGFQFNAPVLSSGRNCSHALQHNKTVTFARQTTTVHSSFGTSRRKVTRRYLINIIELTGNWKEEKLIDII
jgi:hypothetical protein